MSEIRYKLSYEQLNKVRTALIDAEVLHDRVLADAVENNNTIMADLWQFRLDRIKEAVKIAYFEAEPCFDSEDSESPEGWEAQQGEAI